MLFDWVVTGQIVATNPVHAVRGPKHVVKTGKTLNQLWDPTQRTPMPQGVTTPIGVRTRCRLTR
jgi:hypothetical protein